MLILSTLSIPVQLLISIIVGRLSAEALGIYASIELLLGLIVVFVFVGGEYMFIKFIPELESKKNQNKFYLIVIAVVSLIYISFISLFINIKEYIIGNIDVSSLSYLFNFPLYVLGFFYLIWSISIANLKGLNELKNATLAQKTPILVPLLFFSWFVFFERKSLNSSDVITSFYLMTFTGIIISSFYILKSSKSPEKTMSENQQIYSLKYSGVIKYAIYIYLAGLVIFTYEKLDQMIIIANFSLEVLGIYFACYKISLLAKFIPKTLNQSILPSFSQMISNNSINEIEYYHKKNTQLNIIFSALISGIIIIFSKKILSLYGSDFSYYDWLLNGFICLFYLGAPGQVNTNLIGIIGDGKKLFKISLMVVIVQIITMYLTIKHLGLFSILLARLLAVVINQIVTTKELRKLFKIERNSINYYLIGALLIIFSLVDYTKISIQLLSLVLYIVVISILYLKEANNFIEKLKSGVFAK